jgi:hypothetical protein
MKLERQEFLIEQLKQSAKHEVPSSVLFLLGELCGARRLGGVSFLIVNFSMNVDNFNGPALDHPARQIPSCKGFVHDNL